MITPTRAVEIAQAAYLTRMFPDHRCARVRWSGGSTQVIEAGDGPPILFVHGGLGEAFQWAPLLPLLAPKYRVIAVDRPGHGLADPFDYRGVNVRAHACEFLRGVLDALHLSSAPVVGSSMGGLWATSLALAHPERVEQLFLVGSPAGAVRPLPFMLRLGTLPGLRQIAAAIMARPTRSSVRQLWGKLLVAHAERLEDDFLDLSVASQIRNHASWLGLIETAVNFFGLRPELLLAAHWARLQPPTTLVWGERDAWASVKVAEAIVAAHPKIRLIRVPDAGHAPWFDDPPAVARALEAALPGTRTGPPAA
jgi:pimeloyl-ACP methyl ester carboxylesterase